ncbi:MAG: site-2 protease family protein [Candidatus Omnitrophica bacterium]|nr:site-2 protease family protein [Candidatus Omnitrophota bacterium]MBU4488092.1 site-2 protease family protein [Candidatus Omnitrophota bacterium]MCG2705606.1 site-2 protease family protein [Candidatus Omnitrophota bacterium]
MGLLSLLLREPIAFFLLIPLLLYSIIAHEMAHGWVASLFGDDTAKRSGRLSLNPKSHLDPMGTLALFFIGFGWAKPVPVDYRNLGSSRRAIIAVSLAGCVTNILIATIALFLLHFYTFRTNYFFAPVLLITARINIILGSFNLIPIPPLDGSRVLMEFLPYDAKYKLARLEPYGFFIIVILLWTGILSPVITFVQNIILGLIGILFSFGMAP